MAFETWYNKNYKKLLVLPALLLLLSLVYISVFYAQTGDFINKDVSLTGGSTLSIQTAQTPEELIPVITQEISDFDIKAISDNSGNQLSVVITVSQEDAQVLQTLIEEHLGYELTGENSSLESTSASLSEDFYRQLIVAIILAFFWMAAVVFIIFAKGKKIKFWTIILNLLFGYFLGNFLFTLSPVISGIIFLLFAAYLVRTYIKYSVPSFAVMLSAFANIVMTLAVVNLAGMKMSTAGILAFLMLIGYSVDTDILLTTRILRKKGRVNELLAGAFKTGTTMTITSIIAVTTALIAVYSFSSVLNEIFIILLIGLGFDLFNTWITNASIIKWYAEEAA